MQIGTKKLKLCKKFHFFNCPSNLNLTSVFLKQRLRGDFKKICSHLKKNLFGKDYYFSFSDLKLVNRKRKIYFLINWSSIGGQAVRSADLFPIDPSSIPHWEKGTWTQGLCYLCINSLFLSSPWMYLMSTISFVMWHWPPRKRSWDSNPGQLDLNRKCHL